MADQTELDRIAEALDLGEDSRSFSEVLSAVWQLKTERDELRDRRMEVEDQRGELDDLLANIDTERERYTTEPLLDDTYTRVLDALEMMVEQYLHEEDGEYSHDFMSAGEYATDVLAELRPDEWQQTVIGVRRIKTPGSRVERGEARAKAFDELQTTFTGAFAFASRVLELIRDGSPDEDYREGCRRLIDTLDSLRVREPLGRGMAQAAAGELQPYGSFVSFANGDDEGEPDGGSGPVHETRADTTTAGSSDD